MYFDSFEAFLAMGRHGPYVWSAYGISLFLICVELGRAWRRQGQVLQAIRRQQRRQASSEE